MTVIIGVVIFMIIIIGIVIIVIIIIRIVIIATSSCSRGLMVTVIRGWLLPACTGLSASTKVGTLREKNMMMMKIIFMMMTTTVREGILKKYVYFRTLPKRRTVTKITCL